MRLPRPNKPYYPLGEFEQLTMLAILQLKDNAYTLPMREEIENITKRPMRLGTIYATLRRLELRGYVHSGIEADIHMAKRLYEVTAVGIKALRSSQSAILAMSAGLDLPPRWC